jgi:hypothetical protein
MDSTVRYLSLLLAQLVYLGRDEDQARILTLSKTLHEIRPA